MAAEAFAPYAGSFKPQSGSLSSAGSKLFGTWTLVVFDNDPRSAARTTRLTSARSTAGR